MKKTLHSHENELLINHSAIPSMASEAVGRSQPIWSPSLDGKNGKKILLEALCAAVWRRKAIRRQLQKASTGTSPQSFAQRISRHTFFKQRRLGTKADNLKEKYHRLRRCFGASGFGRGPDGGIPAALARMWADFWHYVQEKKRKKITKVEIGASKSQKDPRKGARL